MKKDVRILLLGESGVGKTSLILSLVSEEFPASVPARAEEITIPGDVTPERIPTNIVDYSSQEQNEEALREEILRANVICLVYSVCDKDTLDKITSKWLPLIENCKEEGGDGSPPIVLVGNKTDQVVDSTLESAIDVMNQYAVVETCIECSAFHLTNVSEMFYYAQKAVLHPIAPLYSHHTGDLTEDCKMALTRIFKICDLDNDQILNEAELNAFQVFCFNAPLQPQALADVKSVVKENCPDGIREEGLALNGFLYLHVCFIQKGRPETTWITLRKFGYEDCPGVISEEYLQPYMEVRPGWSVELSSTAISFLQTHFDKHDKDQDGQLSPEELECSFSSCLQVPWGPDVLNTVCTDTSSGWITSKGYMAQWMLTAYLDRPRALEYLGLLGYPYEHGSLATALQVIREKRGEVLKSRTSRNVFLCHVIGPCGVGKTHLLQGLIGRARSCVTSADPHMLSAFTMNTVRIKGAEKYLLMREIDADVSTQLIAGDLACDVACLVYDVSDPTSFAFCAKMFERHFENQIPVLIVGCKSELRHNVQRYTPGPQEFCRRNNLLPVEFFSSEDRDSSSEVYRKLVTLACRMQSGERAEDAKKWFHLSIGMVGLGMLTMAAIGLYKYVRGGVALR